MRSTFTTRLITPARSMYQRGLVAGSALANRLVNAAALLRSSSEENGYGTNALVLAHARTDAHSITSGI